MASLSADDPVKRAPRASFPTLTVSRETLEHLVQQCAIPKGSTSVNEVDLSVLYNFQLMMPMTFEDKASSEAHTKFLTKPATGLLLSYTDAVCDGTRPTWAFAGNVNIESPPMLLDDTGKETQQEVTSTIVTWTVAFDALNNALTQVKRHAKTIRLSSCAQGDKLRMEDGEGQTIECYIDRVDSDAPAMTIAIGWNRGMVALSTAGAKIRLPFSPASMLVLGGGKEPSALDMEVTISYLSFTKSSQLTGPDNHWGNRVIFCTNSMRLSVATKGAPTLAAQLASSSAEQQVHVIDDESDDDIVRASKTVSSKQKRKRTLDDSDDDDDDEDDEDSLRKQKAAASLRSAAVESRVDYLKRVAQTTLAADAVAASEFRPLNKWCVDASETPIRVGTLGASPVYVQLMAQVCLHASTYNTLAQRCSALEKTVYIVDMPIGVNAAGAQLWSSCLLVVTEIKGVFCWSLLLSKPQADSK